MSNVHAWFERRERANGETFTTLAENAPEWLKDAVYEAHEDESPNDWRYEICAAIVSELDNADDLTDVDTFAIADGLVDIYNFDLVRWVADDISRGYIEVVAELFSSNPSTFDVIRLAQYETISVMVYILARAMADAIEGADDGE